MTKVKFTEPELESIKTQLLSGMTIPPDSIDAIIKSLGKKAAKVKAVNNPSDKGVKIALKRKANDLGVSFSEMTIKSDKSIKLHGWTGVDADVITLRIVAEKNGYTLV